MRKLSTTLAIVGALYPLGAQSLGVGEIRLQSALNQTLRAEIPVLLAAEQFGDLKVGLASPQEFAKAGLERSHVLSKLRFTPIRKSDGTHAIKVASAEMIHEPFLSFLLEVTWPQGRLVRNFTVLLDPPKVFAQQALPRLPPRWEEDAAEADPSVPEESSAGRAPGSREIPLSAAVVSTEVRSGGQYGPVRENEKLWDIAEAVKPDPSITSEQMVMALFRYNPHAFSRPNVNALNSGAMLRIPDRDYVLAMSPSVAREEFYRHQPGHAGSQSSPWYRKKRLRSEIPESRTGRPSAHVPADISQQVAEPTGSASEKSNSHKPEVAGRETEEMRRRLTELEKRVSDLQTQVREKAALEPRLQPGAESVPRIVSPPPAGEPVTERPPVPAVPSDTTAGESVVSSTQAAGAATPAPHNGTSQTAPTGRESDSKPASAAPPTPTASSPTPDGEVIVAAPDAEAPTRLRTQPKAQANDPPPKADQANVWTLSGAGIMVASLIGTFLVRRHKQVNALDGKQPLLPDFHAGLEMGPSDEHTERGEAQSATPADEAPAPNRVTPGQSHAPSHGELDEVDPIFESEVYVSYGKYKHAEETLRSAIIRQPERADYQLKLLEVLLVEGKKTEFEAYVHQLKHQNTIADPDFWNRVSEISQKFSPESTPFEDDGDTTIGLDGTDHLIAELKRFSVIAREKSSGDSPTGGADYPVSDRMEAHAQTESEHEIPWCPVDLETPPLTSAGHQWRDKKGSSTDQDHLISFENSGVPAPESPLGEAPAQAIDGILKELSAIQYERHEKQAKSEAIVPSDGAFTDPTGSLSPAKTATVAEAFTDGATMSVGDLESSLDLAKAYAGMEDYAQAKELLSEVVEKGTEAQRNEATTLLSGLP